MSFPHIPPELARAIAEAERFRKLLGVPPVVDQLTRWTEAIRRMDEHLEALGRATTSTRLLEQRQAALEASLPLANLTAFRHFRAAEAAFRAVSQADRLVQQTGEAKTLRSSLPEVLERHFERVDLAQSRFREFDRVRESIEKSTRLALGGLNGAERLWALTKALEAIQESLPKVDRTVAGAVADAVAQASERDEQADALERATQSMEDSLKQTPAANTEELVERLIQAIHSLKDTQRERLAWIVITVLVDFMLRLGISQFPASDARTLEEGYRAKARIVAEVMKEAKLDTALSDLALVTRDMTVRSQPRKASPKLGTVLSGDVVKIIRKARHWSRIEFVDPLTGQELRGWIYSRYVIRVR